MCAFLANVPCNIIKKSFKTLQTSAWPDIILSFSDRIMVVTPSFPFLERKGLMVGQKSLDFGPPAHLSQNVMSY